MSTFYENYARLCELKGESPSGAAEACGLQRSTVTRWRERGSVPTITVRKAVAAHFGVPVEMLTQEGAFDDGMPEPAKPNDEPNAVALDQSAVRMVPVFASASAGFGATAVNEIIDYQPIFIRSDEDAANTLCVRVTGDSMFPQICDGDIVQVQKRESIDSGELGVVLVDGDEGLVKRVVYTADYIELQSVNPTYPPRRFNGPDVLRVRVVGRVQAIIRKV